LDFDEIAAESEFEQRFRRLKSLHSTTLENTRVKDGVVVPERGDTGVAGYQARYGSAERN
jgi:hypothetical protein